MSAFNMNTSQYSYNRFSIDSTIQSNNISCWVPAFTSSPVPIHDVESNRLARASPVQSDCSSASVASGSTFPIHKSKKSRKRNDPSYIRRPRNAFIVFRSHFINARKLEADAVPQNELSREAGREWQAMDNDEKDYYREIARAEKEWHRMQYPNYQYTPQRSGKPRKARTTKRVAHAPPPASPSPSPEATEPEFVFDNGYCSTHAELEAEQTSFHDALPQSLHYGSDTYMCADYTQEAHGTHEEEPFSIDWVSFMSPSELLDSPVGDVWGANIAYDFPISF